MPPTSINALTRWDDELDALAPCTDVWIRWNSALGLSRNPRTRKLTLGFHYAKTPEHGHFYVDSKDSVSFSAHYNRFLDFIQLEKPCPCPRSSDKGRSLGFYPWIPHAEGCPLHGFTRPDGPLVDHLANALEESSSSETESEESFSPEELERENAAFSAMYGIAWPSVTGERTSAQQLRAKRHKKRNMRRVDAIFQSPE